MNYYMQDRLQYDMAEMCLEKQPQAFSVEAKALPKDESTFSKCRIQSPL